MKVVRLQSMVDTNRKNAIKEGFVTLYQSLAALIMIGAVLVLVFKLFYGALALVGLHMSLPFELGVWYVLGIPCAAYWPYRYWADLEPQERRSLVLTTPLYAVFGPLALIARFPI